jgi:hypothetical protein
MKENYWRSLTFKKSVIYLHNKSKLHIVQYYTPCNRTWTSLMAAALGPKYIFYFLLWFILLGAFVTISHFTGITNSESTYNVHCTYSGKFDNKFSRIFYCAHTIFDCLVCMYLGKRTVLDSIYPYLIRT